ncbi:hypothetical protein N7486_003811 [Penicillium sp. IBT 16267x]|nr:hypothetical protein N7486_003811 [Penicillium sp. IBT 16267x]
MQTNNVGLAKELLPTHSPKGLTYIWLMSVQLHLLGLPIRLFLGQILAPANDSHPKCQASNPDYRSTESSPPNHPQRCPRKAFD